MSATYPDGKKFELPRSTPIELTEVERQYAGDNRKRLKRLAALQLIDLLGWPRDMVAALFGHDRGTVRRQVQQARRELEERIERDPNHAFNRQAEARHQNE